MFRILDRERLWPVWSTTRAVRADDLVVLELAWKDLRLGVDDGVAQLVAEDGGGLLAVHFQPQHVEEQAIFDTAPELTPPATDLPPDGKDPAQGPKGKPPGYAEPTADTIARSRLAATSRLVFEVPAGFEPIDFTVAGVLAAMERLPLHLHPGGAIPRRAQPGARGLFGLVDGILDLIGKRVADLEVDLDEVLRGLPFEPPDTGPLRALGENLARRLLGQRDPIAPQQRSDHTVRVASLRRADVLSGLTGPSGVAPGRHGGLKLDLDLELAFDPPLRAPKADETAIELPRRLILSPNVHAAFTHEHEARRLGTSAAVELWHTRLGVRAADGAVDERAPEHRTLRAIWSRSGLPPWVHGTPRYGEPTGKQPGPDEDPGIPIGDRIPKDAAGNVELYPLDGSDRWEIVHLTADFRKAKFEPDPVDADRLHLSALGGWLESRGAWAGSPFGALSEWRHRATLGRDHFVRVVYEGVLLPWGHRAALIKISERRFHDHLDGSPAFLRQRMYVVVRQPELRYVAPQGTNWDRTLPFTRVRFRTLMTPAIDPPGAGVGQRRRNLFVPHVGGEPFQFTLRAETLDQSHVDFTSPAVLALYAQPSGGGPVLPSDEDAVNDAIGAFEDAQGNGLNLGGARMAVAPVGEKGDTVLPVDVLRFDGRVLDDEDYAAYKLVADRLPGDKRDPPRCFPCVQELTVQLPIARHLAGASEGSRFRYERHYVDSGFGPGNVAEAFLEAAGTPTGLDFTTRGDKSGGLVQPSFAIQGLTRKLGPVSGTAELNRLTTDGTFDPADFFGDGFDPLLFGVIPLSTIVDLAPLASELDHAPRFLTEAATMLQTLLTGFDELETQLTGAAKTALDDARAKLDAYVAEQVEAKLKTLRDALDAQLKKLHDEIKGLAETPAIRTVKQLLEDAGKVKALIDALRLAEELTLRFDWRPKLKQVSVFVPNKNTSLVVAVEGRVKTRSGEAAFDVSAKLDSFSLELIRDLESFLEIDFDRLHLLMPAGEKPDVICDVGEVRFVGCLSFIEALRKVIPLDGFSDPPALTVDASGVKADYSLALPDLSFGVFTLQNLALSAGFTVPFIAKPLSARFSFCERESPFLLTVSGFGGGGFVTICVDPDGVQALEAGFEFGASVAMNFGVASGEVHVMGGFVYAMVADKASLTGYLRIGGSVEALGIVTVSIELTLELKYQPASGKCVGKATLEIEVEVAFFSVSVELECERRFAGSNGDPPFAWVWGPPTDLPPHLLPPNVPAEDPGHFPWNDYCAAFAEA